ncbi:hypothetical protein MBLNU457_3923t1 [Dothideomycetes sp. NU457]
MQPVDLLILGAGWTSTFLIPLLERRNITHAATSTTGRDGTIKFTYDPSSPPSSFSVLPAAKHILITFPLTGPSQSSQVISNYKSTHPHIDAGFIQLGSTGIFQIEGQDTWVTRRSRYNKSNARAVAEDELLGLGGCVLNLSGLWGGPRQPKNWVSRVAKTKDDVKGKKSLHMVHGEDVARAVVAVCAKWERARGQRWMLTDGFVYDWWALFAGWADVDEEEGLPSEQARWVWECMREEEVRALPRPMEALGRCYDSREFWETFGLVPLKARI